MSEQGVVDRQLRTAWLYQLQAEFEDICFQYRINLQPPVFELTDSCACLGSWHDRYRLLSISTHLIRTHPWQITLQVLKHEMAHQICSDILAAPHDGHGPQFQKACNMLGMSEPFCRAKADCAEFLADLETLSSPQTEEGRRVLSRVEKLLALAGSDNKHEAALAMQRAGELLSRHNLSMEAAGDEKATYRHLTLNTDRQRMPGYLRGVCLLLQDYFFVQVICASVYHPEKNIHLRTIELFGRPENVAVAEHCYHFLTRKLVSLWQKNRHRFPGGRQRARNSYFHGVLVGFREKLAVGEQQWRPVPVLGQEKRRDLILTEDAGLNNFITGHFPRVRKRVGRKIQLHADAYQEAVVTGKTLVLHRALEESSSEGGGLLEGALKN